MDVSLGIGPLFLLIKLFIDLLGRREAGFGGVGVMVGIFFFGVIALVSWGALLTFSPHPKDEQVFSELRKQFEENKPDDEKRKGDEEPS